MIISSPRGRSANAAWQSLRLGELGIAKSSSRQRVKSGSTGGVKDRPESDKDMIEASTWRLKQITDTMSGTLMLLKRNLNYPYFEGFMRIAICMR